MIAIKRASIHRQLHACSYSQRLIQSSRLIGSFPHTQNEESNNEGEYCKTIEYGDYEIMVWEKVYSSMIAYEAYSIVSFIKDDSLMMEEEISEDNKIYVRINQHIYSQHTLLFVVASQYIRAWGDVEREMP